MGNSNTDDQILNSILSTNEILIGSSTSKSMAAMYLNLSHATGMMAHNAVSNQQHLNILGAAAAAAGATGLLRNGMADQIEKMTPNERLNYLQKLLILTTNPTGEPTSPADESPAQSKTKNKDDTTTPASGTTEMSDDSAATDTTAT
ncbi:RebB family R body protein [Sneathiella litorea]|uniref:Killing trait domain-containing protein n=1 Tax=Sneathiella litorea TaxID=2606216 RepID=A0A6L8WBC9_9PROT|nr:RebB family R body protein [Sneathiella litorea]MZR31780.1 hypothetical protein [Sneathiella litorea]